MKQLSEILKTYQQENHYTYQKMANQLEISKSSIYAYIHEYRNPTIISFQKISKFLEKPMELFLDNSKESEKEGEFLKALCNHTKLYQYLLENPEEKIMEIEKLKKDN